ncbi:hypothetical protein BGZ96_001303 [Linnemannia gamsii]|uniref:Zn(2)-C6 fungal-type domain-containing protein n=1 Tax=Linnemannia gamsii TaxID=64522 RepID=A0ABQ7KA86_9FUNG|nr:hypothetical protein BGZ96_001303 [Linnemannia gamsii]
MSHHHHHPRSIDPNLAHPAFNKRKNVTQAYDRCRKRKTVCDGDKPACRRCYRDKVECSYLLPSQKRGPIPKPRKAISEPTPATTTQPSSNSNDASNHQTVETPVEHMRTSVYKPPTSTDPFSKEVTDHLIEVFFDHNFKDYNFFSPVEFLHQYAQGTANTDPIYAMCSVAARYSDHPAVA